MEYAALIPMMEENATRENIINFAQKAEALGFDALFASDHVVTPYEIKPVYKGSADGHYPFPKEGIVVDPFVAMTVVGTVTERLKVATAVLVLPLRNPVVVAKLLSSIDHMTGGPGDPWSRGRLDGGGDHHAGPAVRGTGRLVHGSHRSHAHVVGR